MLSLILMREGKELISQPIGEEGITIGRSSNNTLQLIDPTISRTHCRIEHAANEITVIDTSRNGILINGEAVSSANLDEEDVLTIGPWTAKLSKQVSATETTVVDHIKPTGVLAFDEERRTFIEERVYITATSPDQSPLKRRLSQSEISFGTHVTADVSVADQYVSRRHCKLILKDSKLILCDLGSTNGTSVDGVRIDKITLPNEGTFSIGKTRVRYCLSQVEEVLTPTDKTSFGMLLGKSQAMREIFSLIKRAAPSEVTICVHGESGTGKELVAREIHRNSSRGEGPFIALNCGAIPSNIIESMLFGHERGAFTGAVERQSGVFEQASGGTLFLDEIGEMEFNLQTRLLRVLEDNNLRRLGSCEETPIDVRLVVATNQDLKKLVMENRFREDLFYRLCVLPIYLPPLRYRKEDIPLLAEYFIRIHAPAGRTMKFADEAIKKLDSHEWHGNVRELKNTLTRAMILAKTDSIESTDIKFISTPRPRPDAIAINASERDAIIDALRKANGNQTQAAKILGIARTTISFKIGRYGIDLKEI
jgi:transcriptional regulator with AAA-type ATPase domain